MYSPSYLNMRLLKVLARPSSSTELISNDKGSHSFRINMKYFRGLLKSLLGTNVLNGVTIMP